MRTLLLLLMMALLLTPSMAAGATYKVCARYDLDFLDATSTVGDDYITNNSSRAARGAYIRVRLVSTNVVVAQGYATESGTYSGCLEGVNADSGVAHTVTLFSEASIGGNYVEVRNNETDRQLFATTWNWTPGLNSTPVFTTYPRDYWNIAAAAGWAASRLDGGLSGETWRWYNTECPSPAAIPSCIGQDPVDDSWGAFACDRADAACDETPAKYKYLIAHQMGHLTSIFANGDVNADVNITAAKTGECDGGDTHKINSEEFQASAAYEGIAHAWAAMAFNEYGSGDDCWFNYYIEPDWDDDEEVEATKFACDAELCSSSNCDLTIDGADYLYDFCEVELAGRGTEVDWLRFWWDMVTDQALTDDEMFEIWTGASPDDWDPNAPSGYPDDQPAARLYTSAVIVGYNSTWITQSAANGTDL